MFKNFLVAALALFCAVETVSAQSSKTTDKFKFESAYGVTWSHSKYVEDVTGTGFGMSQTVLYTPFRRWGFGLEFGMDRTKNLNNKSLLVGTSDVYLNSIYVGPVVSFSAIKTDKSNLYVSTGIDYAKRHYSRMTWVEYPQQNWDQLTKHMASWQVALGYTYQVTNTIGVGAKAHYLYLGHYGYNLSALCNVTFSF